MKKSTANFSLHLLLFPDKISSLPGKLASRIFMRKAKKWAAKLDLEKKGKEKKRKHEGRIEIDLRKEKTKQASLAS